MNILLVLFLAVGFALSVFAVIAIMSESVYVPVQGRLRNMDMDPAGWCKSMLDEGGILLKAGIFLTVMFGFFLAREL